MFTGCIPCLLWGVELRETSGGYTGNCSRVWHPPCLHSAYIPRGRIHFKRGWGVSATPVHHKSLLALFWNSVALRFVLPKSIRLGRLCVAHFFREDTHGQVIRDHNCYLQWPFDGWQRITGGTVVGFKLETNNCSQMSLSASFSHDCFAIICFL